MFCNSQIIDYKGIFSAMQVLTLNQLNARGRSRTIGNCHEHLRSDWNYLGSAL